VAFPRAISWWRCVVSLAVDLPGPVASKTRIPESRTSRYGDRRYGQISAFWFCQRPVPAQTGLGAFSEPDPRLRLRGDIQRPPRNRQRSGSVGTVLFVGVALPVQTTGPRRSADTHWPGRAK